MFIHSFIILECKKLFWHSTSHILGNALEKYYEDKIFLCDGPSTEEGYFYEFYTKDPKTEIKKEDMEGIEKIMEEEIKKSSKFEKMKITKREAEKIFAKNESKLKIIQKINENDQISLYRCGDFVDLCRGPHLPDTNKIKAFKLNFISGSRDSSSNQLFYRVYGVSFPSSKLFSDWIRFREEAAKRDHREIGRKQNLLMFHKLSPGISFFFFCI